LFSAVQTAESLFTVIRMTCGWLLPNAPGANVDVDVVPAV